MIRDECVGKDWTAGTFLNKETGEVIQLRRLQDGPGVVDGKYVYEEDATCESHYDPLPIDVQAWNQIRLPDQDDYSYGCQRAKYETLQHEYYRLQMILAHPPHTQWFVWEEDGTTETLCDLSIIETINNAADIYQWQGE